MHILFLTHYFPPEVNAPASRTYENAKRWVRQGHQVTVMTCAPNHPRGVLYPGYGNRWFQPETLDGIHVLRIKTYLSANRGVRKRILNYLSYMIAAIFFCPMVRHADVAVSTSPQFFCGMAGYIVARIKRIPWVLEIRDLWPESIVAVGAIRNRRVIGLLEGIESFLYRKADHVIALTRAFKKHILNRGVPDDRVSVVTNGADLERFKPHPRENGFRRAHRLEDKFLLSYVGTHGMAHGLSSVLRAANRLRHRRDIMFLLVGDGAERGNLLKMKSSMRLNNVLMLSQQPKEMMPVIIAASDACMVLLKDTPLFRTVIPSKLFEAMAMQRAIILGVKGESRHIIETGRCGICIDPESGRQLAETALRLADDRSLTDELGTRGLRFVRRHYSRDALAADYLALLTRFSKR
jgi:glycosyltransferase involved in cell wall biosynthesis